MNEALFLLHISLIVFAVFGALRLGKETLIAFAALQAILANFFVLKQIYLFGWSVTCSDVFAVGSLLSLNLLQEYFGREAAKKTVWICFLSMLFFGLMSFIHLHYKPSPHDAHHSHYVAILIHTPRLLLASVFTFFLVQQIDVALFWTLKKWQWRFRSTLTLALSQLLDTVFFSFLGLYGLVFSLSSIISFSFLLKLLMVALITFLSPLAKRVVRHEV